ncbi:Bacillopeptidase F [Orchesella cincta]|uniref:Bacillopeptidase F n=1 Tax=Orchesella cincta TaxID=48709 RepID=A0A1D2NBG2_ORCCI|nr:Bacillopeptidase F [Orchesella cincta]
MLKFVLVAALVGAAFSIPARKIDGGLVSSLETKQVANVMVNFVGGNVKVISAIENMKFASRTQRITTLKANLKSQAEISQQNVQNFLKNQKSHFKSFWISNQIFIRGATKQIVEAISSFAEVAEIHEERIIELDSPVAKTSRTPGILAEWGIEKIQAEEAWEIANGTGIVVSNIDTGVRYTHEAVRDNYRSDYGWFDPYSGTDAPNDGNGHGTHTMGTIAGSKDSGVGVAPGATWVACKGCSTSSCTESALTACGEWTVCPTLPDGSAEDCSKAPHLSSNSWGGGRGDLWYESVTEAMIAAGIVPLFSIGNSGPYCGTSNSPGDLRRVIGVGSTNVADEISYFSSVGPAADGRIKPEISAPGEDVRSSVPDSDTSYGTKSGTSMACPHAAGAVALLLSVNPDLTFAQVRQALIDTVDTDLTSQNDVCGGIADNQFPNHHFGFGRINALKLVEAAKASLNK